MKYTRCEGLLLLKPFFVLSSLENYFEFRTTNVRVKTDLSVSLRWMKRFEHGKEVCIFLTIVHSINELILRPVLAIFRWAALKLACILLLVVTITFFICPHIFTFAEPAIFLSSVKEP